MENNTPAQSQDPNETMHHGDVNFNTTDQTTQPPAPRRSLGSTIVNIILILFIGIIIWGGVTYYNNNIRNKDSEPSPTPVISDEEANQDSDVKGDETENGEESSEELQSANASDTTNGETKGGDVLGKTTVVKVEKDVNDPNNWDIVRITSHGITFKHPKMNYTCCGIQGPLTGNPGEVVVLADTSTVTEGTNKPFNGLAMYMIFNDEGINLNDYLNTEKEELLKKYEEVKGTRGENPTEQDVNLSGKGGKLLKGYAYWGDVYYLQLDDKHILYITKTNESGGSFTDTFNKILETLQFAY